MKKFIAKIKSVIIGMMLFVAAVFSSFAFEPPNHQRFCSEISFVAGVIMHKRQTGANLSATLDHYDRLTSGNATLQPLLRSIVMQAFSQPAYSTAEVRNEVIREFENMQMLSCMRAFARRTS